MAFLVVRKYFECSSRVEKHYVCHVLKFVYVDIFQTKRSPPVSGISEKGSSVCEVI